VCKIVDKRLQEFAAKTFRLEENEGEDKVTSLYEAIQRSVKPGMTLHISPFGSAATREIMRQFWGTKPEFTLIAPPILGVDMIQAGLVKKTIGGSGAKGGRKGQGRGKPGALEHEVPNEIWSLGGISQRLFAGAMGTGFIPTKSMIGTTIAEDNKDAFKMIDDPFGSGKKIGVIKALNPDLSIIHGYAADRYGNTILCQGDSICDEYSALASKNKVVVTVERLVSTEYIREHSPLLVKIPGYRVASVTVVPFGAHPNFFPPWRDLQEFPGYFEDEDMVEGHRKALYDPEALEAWIKKWVLDCPNHEDYLRLVGPERIQKIKDEARVDQEAARRPIILDKVSTSMEFNDKEMMIAAGSRIIKEAVLTRDRKVILCGVGPGALVAFLAHYQLKQESHHVALMGGNGIFDFSPRPGEPNLTSYPNWNTMIMRLNYFASYNLIINAENQQSIAIIGAGQIDKYGNMNSGIENGKIVVAGPGGAADAYQACETLAVINQSKTRFLDKVAYITSCGAKIKTLVSSLGVYEKLGSDEEFTLTGCLPNAKFPTMAENITNIRENCGWEIKVSPAVKMIPPPTYDELMTLRILDPDGIYRGQ
jgi:acyl CoA:acetate/3-ketoacid CoA transferase alpha subunit/acyl CoA:acetate/3-ketoacid CoA transferase beta subunit